MEIAKRKKIKPTKGGRLVKSQSSDNYLRAQKMAFMSLENNTQKIAKSMDIPLLDIQKAIEEIR